MAGESRRSRPRHGPVWSRKHVLNGQGVPQDIVRAYAWFSLSELLARSMTLAQKTKAERLAREWKSRKQSGATPSEFMIGDLDSALAAFRGGDYATAIQLFRQFAERGNPSAQFYLGFMYANARGVPKNYAEALKWYRLAAD